MCVIKSKECFCVKTNDFLSSSYLQHEQEKGKLEREKRELCEAQNRLAMHRDEKRQGKNFEISNLQLIINFIFAKQIVHKVFFGFIFGN